MPSIVSRLSQKVPKVLKNGLRMNAPSAIATAGMQGFYTIPMTPQPASNSLGSNNSLYFDIERDECGEIDDVCLKLTVSCSTADVTAVPPYYWFKRIVIESEKGSGDELAHIYPEQMVLWHWLLEEEEARDKWSKLSNFANVKLKGEESEKFFDNEKTKFRVGETKEIYLQIPVGFLHMNSIDMKHVRSDLRIRMELSNDIIVSGSASNLSLDNIHLLVNTFQEEAYDQNERKNLQKNFKHGYIYLDAERLQINDKTLTAGQTTKFNLDQFVGKCPFLVVVIKPNSSPVASDRSLYNYTDIGESKFDITNSSSQSLYGNGTPIKATHLREIFCNQTGNKQLKGVYVIPFCESIKKSFSRLNGCFDFYGLRDYLEIKFDDAPTSEVHTITQNAVSSAGTYRYAFENGVISDQELDYNSNASAIKAVVDAIPQLAERNISVTAGGDLTSTTQTITFNSGSGRVVDELGKISIIGNGTSKVNNTAVTTYGEKGFTTGSNYQVEIFMYKYKCLKVDEKGNISCKDL